MFISADKALPTLNPDGTKKEFKLAPVKDYGTPLVVYAKHKATLKQFFNHYRQSYCKGPAGETVAVFYGRYRQQRGDNVQKALRKDTDFLKDLMAAKHGMPAISEVIQELMTSRKKFVLISHKNEPRDPRLFRHQLEIVHLNEANPSTTAVSFGAVSDLLKGQPSVSSSGLEARQRMGIPPNPISPNFQAQMEMAFSMSVIEIN
jgi:hypothetical protein